MQNLHVATEAEATEITAYFRCLQRVMMSPTVFDTLQIRPSVPDGVRNMTMLHELMGVIYLNFSNLARSPDTEALVTMIATRGGTACQGLATIEQLKDLIARLQQAVIELEANQGNVNRHQQLIVLGDLHA
jgi:hypothetical protein